MSGHTPGPWSVGDKPGVWVGPVITANSGKKGIAFVVGQTDSGWLGGYETSAGEDRTNANARLIAAAPELLLALKNAMRHGGMPECFCDKDDPTYQCNGCFARAAISKAEAEVADV